MCLKDLTVEVPFDRGPVVIRNEKTVEYQLERTYSSQSKNSRVVRRVIGKMDPLHPGRMFPNENYFRLIPNKVPEEIRDRFLRECARKREMAELRKNPAAMMRKAEHGIHLLQEQGRRIAMKTAEENREETMEERMDENREEGREENTEEPVWFISDEMDLEYLMKVFRDLYDLMGLYAHKRPNEITEAYKVKMFNRILDELKQTLPDHRILQCLEFIEEPGEESCPDGSTRRTGRTNSDVLMLLTWYRNALKSL